MWKYNKDAIDPAVDILKGNLNSINSQIRNNKQELNKLIEKQTLLKRQRVIFTDQINKLTKYKQSL